MRHALDGYTRTRIVPLQHRKPLLRCLLLLA
jgi:hypothetical protein